MAAGSCTLVPHQPLLLGARVNQRIRAVYFVHFRLLLYLSGPLTFCVLPFQSPVLCLSLSSCHNFLAWNAVIILFVVPKLLLGSFGCAPPPPCISAQEHLALSGRGGCQRSCCH